MSEVSYTYSIINDFNGDLNTAQFHIEISNNVTIGPYFIRIDTINDDVYIVFSQSLTAGELTILNDMITNYIYIPSSSTESYVVLSNFKTGVKVSSSAYFAVDEYIIPDNTLPSLTSVFVTVTSSNVNTYFTVRFYDVYNKRTLAQTVSQAIVANNKNIINVPILLQPITGNNIFEIQIKRDSGSGNITYNSSTIRS